MAGWAQAIGAILAIGAAFLISQNQILQAKRLELHRREAKARALSYLLAPAVAAIVVNSDHIKRTIASEEYGMLMVTRDPIDGQRATRAMTFGVEIDHDLLQNLDVFPAGAALKIVQLFSFVEEFDDFVCEHLPEIRGYDGETRAAYKEDIDQKFGAITLLAVEVQVNLDSICK